jgi:hypothetical protein
LVKPAGRLSGRGDFFFSVMQDTDFILGWDNYRIIGRDGVEIAGNRDMIDIF